MGMNFCHQYNRYCGESELNDKLNLSRAELADLRKRLEAAEADNAAMRGHLQLMVNFLWRECRFESWEGYVANKWDAARQALIVSPDKPSPGSSLLSRHAEEIAAKDAEIQALKDAQQVDAERIHLLDSELADTISDRDHWKANHADMVMRNAALLDRPDLKERADGYLALVDKFEADNAAKDKRIDALVDENANLIDANQRAFLCFNNCAGELGPEYADTLDGLPKAIRHIKRRIEALMGVIKAMREAGMWLYDNGCIDFEHDDGCPQDDCCICLPPRMISKILDNPEIWMEREAALNPTEKEGQV
jgi:hypothetical protein